MGVLVDDPRSNTSSTCNTGILLYYKCLIRRTTEFYSGISVQTSVISIVIRSTQVQCFFCSEDMADPKATRLVPLESYSSGYLRNGKKIHGIRVMTP